MEEAGFGMEGAVLLYLLDLLDLLEPPAQELVGEGEVAVVDL